MQTKGLIRTLGAATLTAALSMSAQASDYINVLTGGTSGVYYPMGVALSKIYNDEIEGAKASVQSTKASVENLNLIQIGRGELGFALGDSVNSAWNGDKEAGFPNKLDKLRGLAAIYPNYIQIVASKASGIKSLADLKGKRVSVGAPRSGTELNARRVFGAAGLSYDDFSRVEYLPFGQSVELIKNRQIDATLQSAGLGVASIRDLSTALDITIVPVGADVAKALNNPAYISTTIPAGTYDGQDADVSTVAVVNFLVTSTNVADDTAYKMTRELFDNRDRLEAAHAAGRQIKLENALNGMPIPLHPGAERYYREVGLIK
ncbi:TRAP transporter TAXI family solute receptor [Marinobacterium sp. MBR-111]|jgi:TRAP transporter TAXI family solute receptor|uniref:TAXI family TRAP transporter solute-binding subunit n=1 Tax=Marinobacterium sp. MBR-111 TaxID=3156463 RepID=UPI003391E16D